MSTIFQKLKSLMMDMYDSLTTCQGRTWMGPLLTQRGSAMDTVQKHQEEQEAFSDISLDTGTTHRWKWFPSSFRLKSQSTSQDNSCDIEQPASTSSPPATPSWKNRHMNPTFYGGNPKSTSNAQMDYWKTFPAP